MAPNTRPFKLSFPEAIEFFKQKLPLSSTRWDQFSGEAQDWAFTIAGITSADLLNDVYKMIGSAIENGISFGEFQKNFTAAVDKAGWTGATPWRTELIFNQNIRNAYAAGRYKQQTEPEMLKRRPYFQWVHGDSRQPRQTHLALNGKVFPADSPFWQTCYCPNGFGCRCRVFALSKRDVEREGLIVEDPPKETVTLRDRMTGKTTIVPALRTSEGLLPIAEPGFTNAPGASQKEERDRILQERLDKLPHLLRKLVSEQLDFSEFLDYVYNPNQSRDSLGRFAKTSFGGTVEAKPKAKAKQYSLGDSRFEVVSDRKQLNKAFEDWKPVLDILRGSDIAGIASQIRHSQKTKQELQKKVDDLNLNRDRDWWREFEIKQGKEIYGDSFSPKKEVLENLVDITISGYQKRADKYKQEINKIDNEILHLNSQKQRAIEVEEKYSLKNLDEARRDAIINIASSFNTILQNKTSKVSGIVDKNGNLQAIFEHKKGKDHVYIEFLASAPWNALSEHEKAIKGAGSSAIEAAIKMSQEQGKGGKVKLMALRDAVPFYKKVGFKVLNDDEDLPDMVLSADKAEEFLARSRK